MKGKFWVPLSTIFVFGFFWLINPYNKPLLSLFLASGVFLLGVYPFWIWLNKPVRETIPVIEFHGLFYALCFGIGGFVDPIITKTAMFVKESDLQSGLLVTVLGLLSLYLGYYLVAPKIMGPIRESIWPLVFDRKAYNWFILFLYFLAFGSNFLIEKIELKLFSQITNTISTFLLIVLLHAWLNGQLSKKTRFLLKWLVLPANVLFFSGLTNSQIAGFVGLCIIVGIIYMNVRKHVPGILFTIAVAIFFFLQPVKGEFRNIVWFQGTEQTQFEKLKVFTVLGLEFYREAINTDQISLALALSYQRLHHLHVTSAVIVDTPASQPYLYGETYLPLLTKWIPRLFWPGKPVEDLGNRWAIQYGYLNPFDTVTSFNLPWLPEMYMNFGIFGIIGINFLIGMLFYTLSKFFTGFCTDSTRFAIGLSLSGSIMFVESHLSMKTGGIIICLMTLTTFMWILSILFPSMVRSQQKNSDRK
ncbi:MAG: hypothetical protein N2513_02980 [Deltaproteobacteria bacterium]|nr:hypothetical protein [Deltaproteobacteria bacterium]